MLEFSCVLPSVVVVFQFPPHTVHFPSDSKMTTIIQQQPTTEIPAAEMAAEVADTNAPPPVEKFLTGFDVFRNEEQVRIKSETKTVFNLMKQMPYIAAKWQTTSDECKEEFKKRGSTIPKPPRKNRKRARVGDSAPTKVQKKKRVKRDPALSKRPCSAFIFFSCERRASLVLEFPHLKPTEVLKCMGMEWKQLVDRGSYQAMSDRDKVRYTEAMTAVKGAVVASTVP